MSKFEVTFAQWDACVSAGACTQVPDAWGRGEMPVINVTWQDAKQYVAWLSQKTGQQYRLPSEAEWEYVARAGAKTSYDWGSEIGTGRASCAVCGNKWDDRQTSPVGSFTSNAFGVFDMHGNVWEWVEDIWHDDFTGAPADGSAWIEVAEADSRVVRGGAWRNEVEFLRADARAKRNVRVRFNTLGFRVVRTLEQQP